MSISVSIGARIPNNPLTDFFNSPEFYLHNETEGSVFFVLKKDGNEIGSIHFSQTEPGSFISPGRGTFGSFSFMEAQGIETIEACVEIVINQLEHFYHAKKILIKAPPFAHNPHQSSLIFNVLYNLNFQLSNHEINYSIDIDENSLEDKMERNNKKRFQKCVREGFVFEEVIEFSELSDVYEIIGLNRQSKGYQLSMSKEQILAMHKSLPGNLFFFRVKKDIETIASAICIRINEKVLYVFYWGDKPGFGAFSPVVFLASGIYNFAYKNGFTLLDAGTSSIHGKPNYGTINFKQNLGFVASLKPTFTKIA